MKPETFPTNILSLPFAWRRLIAVGPDNAVQAYRAGTGPTPWNKPSGWTKKRVLRLALLPTFVSVPLEIADARRANESSLDVLCIGDSEAQQPGFRFPPSHPRPKTLYVAHPTERGRYYQMANFHRLTFEQKFAEVIRLLSSLGATKITVEHEMGWSDEFIAKAGLSLPEEKVKGSVNAKKNASSNSSILFEASYEDIGTASLPKNLVWYEHEPLWQEIAEGRLERKMKTFELELTYTDNFGITADLSVKAKDVGLDIGGTFDSHTKTIWKISGEFGTFARAAA